MRILMTLVLSAALLGESGNLASAWAEGKGVASALWTCARADPACTGAVETGTELRPPLKRLWTVSGKDYEVKRVPLVGDKAVVTSRVTGGKRFVVVLDRDTGKEKWSHPTTHHPVLSEDGKTVYLLSEGKLFALAIDTGQERWSTPIAERRAALACVSQGIIYQLTPGREEYREVIARREADGKELWRFGHEGEVSYPCIGDSRVYLVTGDGVLHALDTKSRKNLWVNDKLQLRPGGWGVTSACLVYEDGRLLVQEGHYYFHTLIEGHGGGKATTVRLFCIDAANGKEIWRRGSLLLDRSPVVYHGVYYGLSGYNDFLALDVKTGRLLWTTHVGVFDEIYGVVYSCGPMVLANGVLYRVTTVTPFFHSKSQMLAIDAGTGKILWHGPEDPGCESRCTGLSYGDGKFFGSSRALDGIEAYAPDDSQRAH